MLQGISSNDPIFGAASGVGSSQLDKDAFMKLLVAQLKNQDPMQPTDNQAFIAQLAEFSALEEMQGVNENLVALAMLQEGNALLGQLTNSSSLIGKTIEYTAADGATATGTVDGVKLVDTGVLLSIGGEEVPLAQVLAVTAGEDGDSGGEDDSDDA